VFSLVTGKIRDVDSSGDFTVEDNGFFKVIDHPVSVGPCPTGLRC